MSNEPPRQSTLSTKLRIYQETLGLDAAKLVGRFVDGEELAQLERGDITAANIDGLRDIARAMGVATGDLLPDPLDPPDLEPIFSGMNESRFRSTTSWPLPGASRR